MTLFDTQYMKGAELFLYGSVLIASIGVFWFAFMLQPSFYEEGEEELDSTIYDEAN